MVERAILTKELIDAAEPPQKGERWIADTKLKGFGLRLWKSSNNSSGKSYCVRVSNAEGRPVRKTLDERNARYEFERKHYWDFKYGHRAKPTFGDFIDMARDWARDEINKIKGRLTLDDERAAQKETARRRIAALTFENAAQLIINGMRTEGLSEAYCDRLFKLFANHVSTNISLKSIGEITIDDISEILISPILKPGNLQILRPFLGQILDTADQFGVHTKASSYSMRDLSLKIKADYEKPQQLSEWDENNYESFFAYLEAEEDKWQQASCIRFYFEFLAPLSQLMSARWDEVFDVTYEPGFDNRIRKSRIWEFNDSWRGREVFTTIANQILMKCLENSKKEFKDTEFWFPSRYRRTVGHIKSIDHIWRQALHKHDLKYISPKLFREAYRSVRIRDPFQEDYFYVPPAD